MVTRTLVFGFFAISLTVLLAVSTIARAPQGQPQGGGGGRGQAAAQATAADVSFDRLLKSADEPQNWLMYSGS
jgi:hypothetical protein